MKKQRILAFLLVISMLFTFAAFNVIAEDDGGDAGIPEDVPTEEATPTPTSTPTSTPEDNKDEPELPKYNLELNFLKSVGVIDESFEPESKITKADMCEMIAKILYPDIDFSSTTPTVDLFNDVKADHAKYGYIKACKDLKIVSGDTTNNFNPDKELSGIDTITIMVNALGYKPFADARGGYPSGYFSISNEVGMLKGVNYKSDEIMNGANVSKIVYNALFVDYVTISSVTGNEISIEVNKGKNILSERLGIVECDAQIVDNGISSLAGMSNIGEDRISLQNIKDGKEYIAYVEDSNIIKYLGYRVKAFIKNNDTTGRNELIYYELHKNVKETKVVASDVHSITSSYIEYSENKDDPSYLKIKINSQNPPLVMVNGYPKLNYDLDNSLKPQDGFITAIDNDGNGTCEILNILDFNVKDGVKIPYAYNIVVDTVNVEDGLINCKFNPQNNLEIKFDNNDKYIILGNPEVKTLTDIAQNDIVSVGEAITSNPNEKLYLLYVERNSIEGLVNSTNGATNELVINNVEYKVSSSVTQIKPNLINSLSYEQPMTFLIDGTGKIAYIGTTGAQAKNYSYIIGVSHESNTPNSPKIKFLDKDGQIQLLEVSPKAKVDGKTFRNANELIALLKTRPNGSTAKSGTEAFRPAVIKFNSNNLINEIDTDTPNYAEGSGKDTVYAKQTFIQYSQEEVEDYNAFKAGYRSLRNAEFKAPQKTVDGVYFVNSDTKVISVPLIDRFGIDKQAEYIADATISSATSESIVNLFETENEDYNYKVMTVADLKLANAYDMQAYDVDPDTGVASLVVLRGITTAFWYQGAPYQASNPMCMFLEKTEVYDEEKGKNVTKIKYTKDGTSELSALIDLDSKDSYYFAKALITGLTKEQNAFNSNNPVAALEKGDIIRVVQQNGYITHIERVYDISRINDHMGATLFPTHTRMQYSNSTSGLTGTGAILPTFPCDVRGYWGGHNNTYTIVNMIAKDVKGDTTQAYLTQRDFTGKFDINNPKSYIIQYLKLPASATVITKKANGEFKIKAGSTSDIKTVGQVGVAKASRLLGKHTDFKFDQLIIYNEE